MASCRLRLYVGADILQPELAYRHSCLMIKKARFESSAASAILCLIVVFEVSKLHSTDFAFFYVSQPVVTCKGKAFPLQA